MKRIAKLVAYCHKEFGEDVCISLDTWKFKPGHTEVEWKLWNGEESFHFKSFKELTDYVEGV